MHAQQPSIQIYLSFSLEELRSQSNCCFLDGLNIKNTYNNISLQATCHFLTRKNNSN